MILPEVLGKDLVDEIVGIILVHFDLFQNDAPLTSDILNGEDRVEYQIAEYVESNRQVLIENFNVETDAFLRRESIHIAADRVYLPSDLFRRAIPGSLENHVLNEMGDAIPLRIFVSGAGFDPYPD